MAGAIAERVRRYILDGSDEDLRRLLGLAESTREMARSAFRWVSMQADPGRFPLAPSCSQAPIRGSRMRSTRTSRRSATRATMTRRPSRRACPRQAHCRPIAGRRKRPGPMRPRFGTTLLTWAFPLERVTGIEPVLSAWEPVPSGASGSGRFKAEETER